MENLWGRLKEPQKIQLLASNSTGNLTKASIRQKVWEFLERNDIANFPRPVYSRIPNFKGAGAAADRLVQQLPEFRDAKTVKVNPDKPQEEVRFRVLEAGKTLIVPTPRLTQGLFNRLEGDPEDPSKDRLRQLASRHGIDNHSKPIPMASRIRLDLVVIGSVAVDRRGHRIGKGEGFADLEFAMAASHHSAVTQDTLVVTTVHDSQVFDSLPEELFQSPHDLPVDVIVTPTEVFRVENRLRKPGGIIWNMLTREKFDQIGILKELQYKELKAGKDTRLKDEQDLPLSDNHQNHGKNSNQSKRGSNSRGAGANGGGAGGGSGGSSGRTNNKTRRERGDKNAAGGDAVNNSVTNNDHHQSKPEVIEKTKHSKNETNGEQQRSEKSSGKRQQQSKKQRGSSNANNGNTTNNSGGGSHGGAGSVGAAAFSHHHHQGVFVGRIPRQARTKDLRDAVLERGLKPSNISWKGVKGFAFMYFDGSKLSESELLAKLKDLKIGDTVLNVEQDRRSSSSKKSANSQQQQPKQQQPEPEVNAAAVTTNGSSSSITAEQ